MGVFINGDIYIKVKPDIFKINDDPILYGVLKITDDITSQMDNQKAIDAINEMRESLLDDLRKKEGSLDYSKCHKFYKLITNGEQIILKSLGNNFIDSIIKYNTFEDVLIENESLLSFLDSSTFVGKHIKSTNPVVDLLGIKCIALYKKDYTLISKIYDADGNGKYLIHAGDEILKDELVYSSEVDYNFDNRDIVYKEIKQQFREDYGRRL